MQLSDRPVAREAHKNRAIWGTMRWAFLTPALWSDRSQSMLASMTHGANDAEMMVEVRRATPDDREPQGPGTGGAPYYHAYDDRYRAIYAHGAPYWTADPEEIRDTTAKLQAFLDHWHLRPGAARLIEFGCGEGHLAEYLLARGYRYCGVDLSPAALAKARQRVAGCSPAHATWICGDITSLPQLPDGSFDAALDNFALHMLEVDADRQRYLREIGRLLVPGGVAYFHENHTVHPLSGPVPTFDDFRARTGFTPDLMDRTAYGPEGPRTIRLPRVPFRAQDEVGHRQEFRVAGLVLRYFAVDGAGQCVLHAQRPGSKEAIA